MIKLLFAVFILTTVFKTYAQNTIINDPLAQVRSTNGFSSINVSDAIDLYLNQDDEAAVAVSAADEKYRDRIKTVVENGVLKISYDSDGWKLRGNKKLKAYVSFKSISRLSASGASDVYTVGVINGDELTIELSGASDFNGTVQVTRLNLNQSGASDASISGGATSLQVDASGASDLKGYDLKTDNCVAKASGASDIKITVNKELNANASGASSIYFRGAGVVKELKSSGASNVNRRS